MWVCKTLPLTSSSIQMDMIAIMTAIFDLWWGVLKWSLTYLTGREGPRGFCPPPSRASGLPVYPRNGGELLHFLTGWRVAGKYVHIKTIKVSSSMLGSNQVRMFMQNLWIVHFLPSFWQSGLPLKSLYLSHWKWQTTLQESQGQFLSMLFPALICIWIWGPYASWQDLLYNMAPWDRRLSTKNVTLHYPSFLLFF